MKNILLLVKNFDLKKKIVILILLLILAIFEFLSIGSLFPVLKSITDKNYANSLIINLNLNLNYFELTQYILLIIIIIFLTKFFITLLFHNLILKFIYDYVTKISTKIFENLLNYNYLLKSNSVSDTIKRLTTDIHYLTFGALIPLFIFSSELLISFSIVLLFIYLFSVNFFFIYLIIFFLIYLLLRLIYTPLTKKFGIERNKNEKQRAKIIYNVFNNFKEILIFKNHKYFENKFNLSVLKIMRASRYQSLIEISPKLTFEFILILIFIIYLFNLAINKIYFDINLIPQLSILAIMSLRFVVSISRQVTAFSQLKYFDKIIQSSSQFAPTNSRSIKSYKKQNFKNLKVSNLSFTYQNQNKNISKNIINNLSFEINKNDFVLILGGNGTGKSTLVNILLGFLKPSKGQVLFNDKLIKKGTELHDTTFYIPQNFFLLNENLDLFFFYNRM